MILAFDLIGDLNLSINDKLNWEGKATSLYCLVTGNISDNATVFSDAITHLSKMYQGVFFIDGSLDIGNIENQPTRVELIDKLASKFKNVVYLHNNVVVIEGVALIGINGWYGNYEPRDDIEEICVEMYRQEDLAYLEKTLERLQLHVDVKKIVVISNAVPSMKLYFGEEPNILSDEEGLSAALSKDTEHKIVYWAFGTHTKMVDATIGGINYINNGRFDQNPYWPKRLEIKI